MLSFFAPGQQPSGVRRDFHGGGGGGGGGSGGRGDYAPVPTTNTASGLLGWWGGGGAAPTPRVARTGYRAGSNSDAAKEYEAIYQSIPPSQRAAFDAYWGNDHKENDQSPELDLAEIARQRQYADTLRLHLPIAAAGPAHQMGVAGINVVAAPPLHGHTKFQYPTRTTLPHHVGGGLHGENTGITAGTADQKAHLERIGKELVGFWKQYDKHSLLSSQTKKAYYWSDSILDAMCCCFAGGDGKTNTAGGVNHAHYQGPTWQRFKLGLATGVSFLYVFAVLWLMFGIQSFSLCNTDNTAFNTAVKDPDGAPVQCSVLLAQCRAPFISDMPVMEYYVFRITVYFLSLIPLMVLVCGAESMTDRYIRLLFTGDGHDMADPALLPRIESIVPNNADRTHSAGWISSLCGLVDSSYYDTDSFAYTSAFCMMFTHIILGFITVAADISVVLYFDEVKESTNKDKGCSSGTPWTFDSRNAKADDRACACQTLFSDHEGNGHLVRLSGAQLMSPREVAWALVVPNILYTIFGLLFWARTLYHSNQRSAYYKSQTYRYNEATEFGTSPFTSYPKAEEH
jgi:hypothetical protein